MTDQFDRLSRALRAVTASDETRPKHDRRTFVKRISGAFAAVGVGLTLGKKSVSAAPAAQSGCGMADAGYEVATEDGVVTDSLGTRYVEAGEYIYPEELAGECTSSAALVSPDSTPGECGITSYWYPGGSTDLGSGWTELACRYCPWTGSAVNQYLYPGGSGVGIAEATDQGTQICRGRTDGRASSVWYRTNGPAGCWIWSGGTTRPNWNRSC